MPTSTSDLPPRAGGATRREAESGGGRELIRAQARAIGFDACRFTSVEAPWAAGERLHAFLGEGRHGSMRWMEDTVERRAHPRAMWPDARSAIVLGLNYGPERNPLEALADRRRGAISVYAQGVDYHELIKKRLKTLGRWMAAEFDCALKVFVDTAPLMEKPLAEAAGLGWQGKHTNLVSREFGSWLFLGVILTDLPLAPDPPETATCGTCTACLTVCPTDAFPAPFQLDARRCLSYLTIEHAGPWPEAFRVAAGNRIYGCDDCLAVCPWNKFASETRETLLKGTGADDRLDALLQLDDAAFRARFRKSPVKRIGVKRFLRNVLYAVGNSGDAGLAPRVQALCDDEDPVVADAARWALARLSPPAPPPAAP